MGKILVVVAHPDDESFSCGGTVAKYTHSGWQADLICATYGENGSRGPYEGTAEPLGDIRNREAERSAAIIGVSSITFLGYKDTKLPSLRPGELEDKIYREIVKVSPDVVITFEPSGGISNHADHKKIARSTTFAFQKYVERVMAPQRLGRRAATENQRKSLEEASDIRGEPKLYYACIPTTVVELLKKKHILPLVSFGKPWMGTPDKEVTTVIDIRRFRLTKTRALQAHVSQSGDVNRFLSYDNNPLVSQEYFILRMQGTSEVFMGKNDRVSNRL